MNREKKIKWIWILSLLLLAVFFACKPAGDKYSSPEGYDLQNMEKFNLTDRLLEISGIAFHKGNGDVVYAVQDEDGDLFRIKQCLGFILDRYKQCQ